MTGPSGRVLSCGIYRTDLGLEVRVGYEPDDLLCSQFAVERSSSIAGHRAAASFKSRYRRCLGIRIKVLVQPRAPRHLR
jgi:hypothetical protein